MAFPLSTLHLQSVTWVRERQAYSATDVKSMLGVSDESVLLKLQQANILRVKTADAEEEPLGNGEYAFSYVGLLCHRGHLVYVLPKYVTSDAASGPMKPLLAQVLRVIHTYKTKHEHELQSAHSEQHSDSYLARLVTLLADYAENGEYRDDELVTSLNSPGRIMWNLTINATTPFMQDGEPVYVDTYNRRLVDAEDHFITRLHRVVVKECCHILQQFGLVELLNLPMVDAIEEDAETLGEPQYLLHRVESELGSQFDSRRRHILHLLRDYLQNRHYNSPSPDDTYTYGSSSFHAVWEDVCRSTLGDDVREAFAIKPPVWTLDSKDTGPVQSLQLDMLFLDDNGETAYVMDAKYYVPYIVDGSVRCLPGVGDVTKQFLYRQAVMSQKALTVHDAHTGNGKRTLPTTAYNAFLMPQEFPSSQSEPVQHYAYVAMGLFDGSRIDTFRLAPEPLYDAYLRGATAASASRLRALLQELQAVAASSKVVLT